MKEIVVISGKGGTGKTSIAASLGLLAGKESVIADCDVDASNLHLLYKPDIVESKKYFGKRSPLINYEICSDCGICAGNCHFNAIRKCEDNYFIDEIDCEGCGLCSYVCPNNAIKMIPQHVGDWFVSKSRFAHSFVYAKLGIAKENTGKLVSKVKAETRKLAKDEGCSFIIIDGPPGIGCPAISSLTGANEALIVTEATNSGLHDLARIIDLLNHFELPAKCIINKANINREVTSDIRSLCNKNNIDVISELLYNPAFIKALEKGLTLAEYSHELREEINKIWHTIKNGSK